MEVKEQITMLELANKGILCFESVKAKMNGSCVASLDRFSTKNSWRLQVQVSELYLGCSMNYFLTQTHFNELSQKMQYLIPPIKIPIFAKQKTPLKKAKSQNVLPIIPPSKPFSQSENNPLKKANS